MRLRDIFDPDRANERIRLSAAASVLGYSESRFRAIVRLHNIPTEKARGIIFLKLEDLANFVDAHGVGRGPRVVEADRLAA